jgi:RAQPRD family integrative conjugative element protein
VREKRSPAAVSRASSRRHLALAPALVVALVAGLAPVGLAAAGLAVPSSAKAADGAVERANLASIRRELNLIDRLTAQAQAAATEDGRYHFDYGRLESDIARIRAGINDYLAPPRAQPRDSVVVSGGYRRESQSP